MDKYEDVVNWESKALEASSQREYDEAIHAHIRALKIANELCRPRLMAVLYNRLGNALETKAQIQKAVNAFESGVKSLAGDPNVNLGSVIDSLRSMAKAYDPGCNYLEVPDLYSETTAEELNEAENDPVLSVKLLINIGNAYLRQPEMDPAMNAYQKALLRPEILEAPVLRAHALIHVGIIQRRRGDVKQAQKSLQEALELFETHGESLEKASRSRGFGWHLP